MQLKLNRTKAMVASLVLLALGAAAGYAANKYSKPKSIIHVVTLYYKDGTTDEQKKAVLDGIEKMASEVPGMKNIWLKGIKVQGAYMEKQADGSMKSRPMTDAFVMEFESEAAFQGYANHPAHKAWEELYVKVRGRSTTHDITN
jgi:hypothetical protein